MGWQMEVKLSSLRAGLGLHLGSFLLLISVRAWVNPRAIVRLKVLGKLKEKSDNLDGIRTRDLSACSIAPELIT
jgi:hypothetical protein